MRALCIFLETSLPLNTRFMIARAGKSVKSRSMKDSSDHAIRKIPHSIWATWHKRQNRACGHIRTERALAAHLHSKNKALKAVIQNNTCTGPALAAPPKLIIDLSLSSESRAGEKEPSGPLEKKARSGDSKHLRCSVIFSCRFPPLSMHLPVLLPFISPSSKTLCPHHLFLFTRSPKSNKYRRR